MKGGGGIVREGEKRWMAREGGGREREVGRKEGTKEGRKREKERRMHTHTHTHIVSKIERVSGRAKERGG